MTRPVTVTSGTLAIGADWVNSARGFMFAVGCIQAQKCHSDRCPTGVATQDPVRQRALNVPDKGERVYHFHRNTLHALHDQRIDLAPTADGVAEPKPAPVEGVAAE